MLDGHKIIFVAIIDNNNESVPGLGVRIWHHEKLVKGFLKEHNCVIGRKTYDITQWKGPKSWVLTSNKKWHKSGIGTIHSIEDFHLFMDGPIYVIGGNSLYEQLEKFVDEVHLFVMNNAKGKDPWIEMDMKDWKPINYLSRGVWSYAHMHKVKNHDPHLLNNDLFS